MKATPLRGADAADHIVKKQETASLGTGTLHEMTMGVRTRDTKQLTSAELSR